MMNGCICCTVRQDLIVVLKNLTKKIKDGKLKLDAIVIETTGMADPAPVAQTFFVDDEVQAAYRLDGIVTMVDAKHIEQHLDEEKPEGAENEWVFGVGMGEAGDGRMYGWREYLTPSCSIRQKLTHDP